MRRFRWFAAWMLILGGLGVCAAPSPADAASKEAMRKLTAAIEPFLDGFKGNQHRFSVHCRVTGLPAQIGETVTADVERFDDQSFVLVADHRDYAVRLERSAERTALILPRHHVAIIGEGAVSGDDTLAPEGARERLISGDSAIPTYEAMIAHLPARLATSVLVRLVSLDSEDGLIWTTPKLHDAKLSLKEDGLTVTAGQITVDVTRGTPPEKQPAPSAIPPDYTIEKVDRAELERLIARALRRATEVAAPGSDLTSPSESGRTIVHGKLRWVEGQRLVMLWGTPEQIGHAHGVLLGPEIRRCLDSCVYMVGLVNTVRTGKWFPNELRAAYARLSPHIPQDHKTELNALAAAAHCTPEETQLANVFPELFHCSGFAAFGRATAGGKLYHGRVLDYMTEIGLQDCAATFIVAPQGKHAFVNVGFAGFTGSVSGMNDQQISLGEMGGRGEGKWDGVPMATLMRRALEECDSLPGVEKLWTDSPRTCEYYYVFADGKIPDAVAVAARPESIEFLKPGQAHAQLGDGIADIVAISAGDRLSCLRQRIQDNYGKIDGEMARGFMTTPVTMHSNLHDVLFVPHDLVCYVAQAKGRQNAAKQPYVKYDLAALLKTIEANKKD